MTKFTKGLWKKEKKKGDVFEIVADWNNKNGPWYIATVHGGLSSESAANARLIAESPMMYALLDSCLTELYESDGIPEGLQEAMQELLERIDGN